MNAGHAHEPSVSDVLIAWTTATALITFGVILSNDAIIIGPAILTLGVLSLTNEVVRLCTARTGLNGGYPKVRWALAIGCIATALIGFLCCLALAKWQWY
jgi:hypothetical protein